MSQTPLERSIAGGQPAPKATPLDVLEAARELWVAGDPVDMSALAEQLRISRATLYRWVGGRERLLGEVVWTFAAAAMEEARAHARGHGPEHVADVVERYMRGALAFAPLQRFVASDPALALNVLASKQSPMQQRSIAAVRALLEEQIDEPPLDLDALAFLVVRIVESFLYSDVITGDEPDIATGADAVLALLSAPPVSRRRARR